MLRYVGVTQLLPQPNDSELEDLLAGDLDDVVGDINGAMQEITNGSPGESREYPGGGLLFGPRQVTLTATTNSPVISAFAGFNASMIGCTIRIQGDTQDNEVVSATALAIPFVGTTGPNIAATVYGDCFTIDPSIKTIPGPVMIPNQIPLVECSSRDAFMKYLGAPLVTDAAGRPWGYPFFYFFQKTVQRPRAWFMEGFYQTPLGYLPRRIRFAPMPDQNYQLSFRSTLNAPFFAYADIFDGTTEDDPRTLIPLPDGWVESILLPIAKQRYTANPRFRNESAKPEIQRQYKAALAHLKNSRGKTAIRNATYV